MVHVKWSNSSCCIFYLQGSNKPTVWSCVGYKWSYKKAEGKSCFSSAIIFLYLLLISWIIWFPNRLESVLELALINPSELSLDNVEVLVAGCLACLVWSWGYALLYFSQDSCFAQVPASTSPCSIWCFASVRLWLLNYLNFFFFFNGLQEGADSLEDYLLLFIYTKN